MFELNDGLKGTLIGSLILDNDYINRFEIEDQDIKRKFVWMVKEIRRLLINNLINGQDFPMQMGLPMDRIGKEDMERISLWAEKNGLTMEINEERHRLIINRIKR